MALKCDRLEFSAKTEAFEFLGARRQFPFTIYHLALIFQRPVVLCVGLPDGPGRSTVHSSPLYRPLPGSKAEDLANVHNVRAHGQLWTASNPSRVNFVNFAAKDRKSRPTRQPNPTIQ